MEQASLARPKCPDRRRDDTARRARNGRARGCQAILELANKTGRHSEYADFLLRCVVILLLDKWRKRGRESNDHIITNNSGDDDTAATYLDQREPERGCKQFGTINSLHVNGSY